MGSYIKIDRKILEWGWYKDEHTKSLFLHCIIKANWKEGSFRGIAVDRGEFVTSIPSLQEELSLTPNEVRTAIKHLKKTGEITVRAYPKFSVFTVVNYDLYQNEQPQPDHRQVTGNAQPDNSHITDKPHADNGQTTGNAQPVNRQLTAIEEEKEREEGKEEKNVFSGDGGDSIYRRVCAEAERLLGDYWGMEPSRSDTEGVRSRIATVRDGKPAVDMDRLGLLWYAFECSANANARNWNYVQGVLDRLAARGIRTAGEAYRYDAGRDMGNV